jgi:type IV pilus assembly protein PilO
MANLRRARQRIYVIVGVLLAVDLAAAAVLLTPILATGTARQQEFDSVRRQVKQKMQIVVPPEQVQTRVEEARKPIDSFYKDRLAGGASALSAELGKLASASGVRLNAARYTEMDPDLPGLTHVRLDASISGDYLSAVKFINAVERDKMFFIMDNVGLAEQQGGNVRLAVTMETYLKSGAE